MSAPAETPSVAAALREGIAGLSPAYFAMVMATGIVSIAAKLHGMPAVAFILLCVNLVAYVVLWALFLTRLRLATGRFVADLSDHNRAVGFFTVVAGTCVLGSQFVLILDQMHLAIGLWILGICLWFILLYSIFTLLMITPRKPTLPEGLNGAWLLPVVATQSVSVLCNLLAVRFTNMREEALFFSLVMWLGGGMLYIWIIEIIFYRYTFFALTPQDLTPPYWINMGAMAISTLAGAGLVSSAHHSALLGGLLPFLKGLTLLFWATATFWIPMLLILGAWRHVYMRFPLRYDPAYWGAVFPLGMYATCTHRLADSLETPFLLAISSPFVYLALAAWLVTLLGLARHVLRPLART